MIDGGKGQLSAVQEVMDELGLAITTIGLAKQEENLTDRLGGATAVISVFRGSEVITTGADEAHRLRSPIIRHYAINK